jgi:hypothetical protein
MRVASWIILGFAPEPSLPMLRTRSLAPQTDWFNSCRRASVSNARVRPEGVSSSRATAGRGLGMDCPQPDRSSVTVAAVEHYYRYLKGTSISVASCSFVNGMATYLKLTASAIARSRPSIRSGKTLFFG